MKLLADENSPRQVVERLRAEGHDVAFVAESAAGTQDIDVLELANRAGAVLLTDDKDFGDLVMFQRRHAVGVILLRLEGVAPAERARIVSELIRAHEAELRGAFTVVKRTSIRIRPLPV